MSRVAALTIINAMVFQDVLSGQDARVHSLRQSLRSRSFVTDVLSHWRFISREIDYVPIFKVACDLLESLPANPDFESAARYLADRALDIVSRRAALRHDLMGRVYHRLLVEAKFLGTYYTSVSAATLLLKLAMNPSTWRVDFEDLAEVKAFAVADLACGTGTLLMAAAEALTDNYVQACATNRTEPDLDELHRALIESVLHGYDVLPSALHLTASTLALRATNVGFEVTNLFSVPHGGDHRRLGSIEFLRGSEIAVTQDLFGASVTPGQVTAEEAFTNRSAVLPPLDLCVMNPPFTRSVGGNLLFGSVPQPERRGMQAELARLIRSQAVLANSTAGLGSVFAAIGDRFVKMGGKIALVLPKALLSGVAWGRTRDLLSQKYELEYLVVSHDPRRWNFSDNTSLSEVLLIAKKVEHPSATHEVTCVNLWSNPRTPVEALNDAQQLIQANIPDIEDGQGAFELEVGDSKVGEALKVKSSALNAGFWIRGCAFGQAELIRASFHLEQGNLYLPGHGIVGGVPIGPFSTFAALGPDRRDIWDGFSRSRTPTAFPALWGHDSEMVKTLAQVPNSFLSPLGQARPGRPLRRVAVLWPRSGRLMLAERLRLNTQRLAAVRLPEPGLSNVWWPARLHDDDDHERREKALCLWLNGTLSLLLQLSNREETEGAWVDFKKPVFENLLVVNVDSLTSNQLQSLADAYDALCDETVQPFSELASDVIRGRIDTTIAETLGLPDFSSLRRLLGQEPLLCLNQLT